MRRICIITVILNLVISTLWGQVIIPIVPVLPEIVIEGAEGGNSFTEGDTVKLKITVINTIPSRKFSYSVRTDENIQYTIDSLGNFRWVPSYDLVDRVEQEKGYQIIAEASSDSIKLTKKITLSIKHRNRPPEIGRIPRLYVMQGRNNEFNLKELAQITDPDNDPFVFKADLVDMPEGANLNELGIFSWAPSRTQFVDLKAHPLKISFMVQDQPDKRQSEGQIIIAPTQMDLAPEILMIPADTSYTINEDDALNLNFYISDPNGDDNIQEVAFLATDNRIPKDILSKNTDTQYELTWTPGYDFVSEAEKELEVSFIVYAIDKSNKRTEIRFKTKVVDTENIELKDRRLYDKYRHILVRTMNVIDHLDENQKELNKQLKKAKKGKKNRSIVSASLGAVTGISPVFLEDQSRDYVSGIGGTAVLTLGTLEATEVLGRSKDDILDRLKINIDIRNELQAEGDRFAREYAFKSERRKERFHTDLDKLKAKLNNRKMILLELDAGWKNPSKPTDSNLKKQFPDFSNDGYEDVYR